MDRMKVIASADQNWGIGFGSRLLAHIPEDLKFFKEMTMGNVVIMGTKTLESLPGRQPLAGRENFVVTHNLSYQVKGAAVVHNIQELLQGLAPHAGKEVYVIGGGDIYLQMLDLCDTAYITKISHAYQADVFFPNLDERKEWELAVSGREQVSAANGLKYRFLTYRRRKHSHLWMV